MTSPASPSVPGSRRLSTRRKLVLTLILTVLVGSMAFVMLETFYRLTKPHIDLWAVTGRHPGVLPMHEWAHLDAFCAYRGRHGRYPAGTLTKTVNQHGFISTPDIDFDKDDDETRIVFLGGSSTAGTGTNLADNQTWPWRVVDTLKEQFPDKKLTLINAALSGFSSFESYGRLWSRLRFYEPDIVVVYHGWNEMYYFSDVNRARNWRVLKDGSWSFQSKTKFQLYEPSWMDHVVWPSQILTRVRIRLARPGIGEVGGNREAKLADSYDADTLDAWQTNLELISRTTELLGAKLFVCKQATLITPDTSDEDRSRCHYHLHGFDHDAHVQAFNDIYRVTDQVIPTDDVIDTTSLSGKSDVFTDHVHLTPEGAQLLANIVTVPIAKWMKQQK